VDCASHVGIPEAHEAQDAADPPIAIGFLLQPRYVERLAAALGGCAALRPLRGGEPDEPFDLLVIDPRLLGNDLSLDTTIRRQVAQHVPAVYYTAVSQEALVAAATSRLLWPERLLVFGEDDRPKSLQWLLNLVPRIAHARRLRQRVQRLLDRVPPQVRDALEVVIVRPVQFVDARDVAAHAGLSRRHLDRVLSLARLAPARHWVVASRAWQAARLLARRGRSVEATAGQLGYPDGKALRRHLRAVWGLTPMALAGAELESLLAQLVAYLGG
jgi:AraC-like DNA-binding protein